MTDASYYLFEKIQTGGRFRKLLGHLFRSWNWALATDRAYRRGSVMALDPVAMDRLGD